MATQYREPGVNYRAHLSYRGLPPIVTSENLPTLELRVRTLAGDVAPLPEAIIDSISFEDSAPNSISIKVPEDTVGYDLLEDLCIVELYHNGEIVDDGRWVLRNQDWNEGLLNRPRAWSGKGMLWDRLGRTKIWNNKRYKYDARSPGFILNDLFTEAQLRGALHADFFWSFDGSFDSDGNGWPVGISIEYLAGADYGDIVVNLVDRYLIDIYLRGDEIRVLVAGKRGSVSSALLVVGEDVTDAPQKGSMEALASHAIVVGGEGTIVLRDNPIVEATYWREEISLSQGGTKDIGTLSIVGDAALSGGEGIRVQRAYNLVVHQEMPFLPIRDYMPSDWVRVEHGNATAMSLRVKQIVLQQKDGQWAGSLVLNDKFLESDIKLAKRVDGILGGASIVGTSQPLPDEIPDTGVPNAPTGLTLSFEQYTDDVGVTKVVMIADWNEVTHNTDGSVATDLEQYRFVWWYTDRGYESRSVVFTDDTTTAISPVDPLREVSAFVYIRDRAGNFSATTPTLTQSTGIDIIAPEIPSSPILLSSMRQVIIAWNGLDNAGQPMAADFRHIEIVISPHSDIPLASRQIVGNLTGVGDFVVSAADYDIAQNMYVAFIAVDHSGNRSDLSAISSIPVSGVVGDDISANTITANNLAVGAVQAVHIGVGALDAGRISLGSTMNLVSDPSFNDVEWRTARLTTQWAEKPSRWFFNNHPFRARNGYYLQALSTADGVNGGRMYVVPHISVQYGETYYFGVYFKTGEFDPNAEARLFLGWEIVRTNGEVVTGGASYTPSGPWTKIGYSKKIDDLTFQQIRFYVRADDLTAGDIIMDDWEVRSSVGTTAVAGGRFAITPERIEAFDPTEIRTILIEAATGDIQIRGQLLSGYAAKRLEINPGSTLLPEIRFYPTTGTSYAYINAVDGGGGATPFIGVNAPDSGSPERASKLILTDTAWYVGEFQKNTLTSLGTAIVGEAGDGYLWAVGKLPGTGLNDRWNHHGGLWQIASGTTGVTISQPSSASALAIPVYSILRPTATFFRHHMSARTNASFTLNWESHATVSTYVCVVNWRGDQL